MKWQHEAMRPNAGRESLDEWLMRVDDAQARQASIEESGVVRWDDGETEVIGDAKCGWCGHCGRSDYNRSTARVRSAGRPRCSFRLPSQG